MPDLGLLAQAQQHLGFLVTEKHYRNTESTPSRIRYESPATFVELVFDGNRSYELGLLVSKTGSEHPPFSIDEILRLRRAPEAGTFSLVQVTTREALATWVEKLAQVFR